MQLLRSRWDVVVAGALVFLSFVAGVAQQGLELAGLPDRPLDPGGLCLIAAQGGSVALLRRWPGLALAVCFSAFAGYQLLGYPTTVAALGLLICLVGAGALASRHRGVIAGAVLAGYVVFAVVLLQVDRGLAVTDAVVFGLMLAALWLWGSWLRTQRASRRERALQAETDAIAAERSRIARELHDVVTHHVTAMVIQAEAGRLRPDLDEETSRVLSSIAEGGRATLVDLRSLLGALEATADDSREPALQTVAEIVARARSTGQTVRLEERGEPRVLHGAAGLAVVRVVQESITNARKHARDGVADVLVEYVSDAILVEVTSPSRHRVAPGATGGGRGIIGMRERVESLGGEMRAVTEGDLFAVRARIPG
ncbi:histidine kinase [Microbacterium sp. p3-SID338]|uniref:sensor histidine kinase n=1 Tax=unclassified Microbacterium TaxID=2609290 RepID=UPI0011AF9F39|nr:MULTISPECIES: histidine kinase [unclassified Microbacterium]MCT1395229.1 histidine kinase [Microbacterium sp. p3-SID338]